MTARTTPGVLLIERAVTKDCGDQPWPPTGLMTGWHLIDSADGKSRWRRISLNCTTTTMENGKMTNIENAWMCKKIQGDGIPTRTAVAAMAEVERALGRPGLSDDLSNALKRRA
jgi:hypothetical protein